MRKPTRKRRGVAHLQDVDRFLEEPRIVEIRFAETPEEAVATAYALATSVEDAITRAESF